MIDKFYTVKIDEGFVHRGVFEEPTENIMEAIRFYSKERAEHYRNEISQKRDPRVVVVTCKYEAEELEECKNE